MDPVSGPGNSANIRRQAQSDGAVAEERRQAGSYASLDYWMTGGDVIPIDDPAAYTKPWSFTMQFQIMPDTELIEDVCDNEKDASRLK